LTGGGNYLGDFSQNASNYAYKIVHGLLEPVAIGFGLHGEYGPALTTTAVATGGAPLFKAGARAVANAQVPGLTGRFMNEAGGYTPPTNVNPNWQQILQSMALGGQQ
jgi:hypothetical protein